MIMATLPKLFSRSRIEPEEDSRPSQSDLRREAKYYAGLLSNKLEQLNVCYRYRKSESDVFEKGVQRVKFDLVVTHPDALYLRIDTSPRKFPRGVSLAMINDEAILTDLSVAAERPIKYKRTADGAWLVVEREMGVFGITQIGYNAVEGHYPKSSLKALQVPLGLTFNHRIVYRSLAEFPHALVGGATGAGKTTFLHGWICTLIQHNKPHDLRLALIDLKGGTEFTRYQKLPHVLEGAFVKEDEDVKRLLEYLHEEMSRRLELFEKRGGIQNIAQWNVRSQTSPRYEHLPRIVLFVDELSAVMLKPNLRKDAVRLFTGLGERGRAPGIHLVLATQRPIVRVVDGQIKGNLEARFAFRVTDDTSSMVILDSIEAARFPEDTPRGRYIYKSGLERMELQAPLITPMQIKNIVNAVLRGDDDEAAEAAAIAPEDVFRAALTMGGDFAIKKLYRAMEGKASNRLIESLAKEYENEVIELDGITYKLLPPERAFESRRLVPTATLRQSQASPDVEAEIEAKIEAEIEAIISRVTPSPSREKSETPPQLALPAPDNKDPRNWFLWALEFANGDLSIRRVRERFKVDYNLVSKTLASMEGQQIELNGVLYAIMPPPGVGKARYLSKVQENEHA